MKRSDVAALVTRVFLDPGLEDEELAFALLCTLTREFAQQEATGKGDFARRVQWLHIDVLENLLPELFHEEEIDAVPDDTAPEGTAPAAGTPECAPAPAPARPDTCRAAGPRPATPSLDAQMRST